MPKVSVIIPVYNVEPYLRESLDSVVNQTLNDIEIICVDDCSTDGCLSILEEYAAKDDRFIILKQEVNQGQGVARNRALDVATGDYIMFLDPDDWIKNNAIDVLYKKAVEFNADYVKFGVNKYFEKNNQIKPQLVNIKLPQNKLFDYKYNKKILLRLHMMSWNKFYKREFLNVNNIRFGSTKLGEDHIVTIKSRIFAKKVLYINEYLYVYRIRKTSMVRSKSYETLSIVKIMAEVKKILLENNLYKEYEEEYNEYLKNLFVYTYPAVPDDSLGAYDSLCKEYLSEKYYKKYKSIICRKNGVLSLPEKIFSVKNKTTHKVITVAGIKIKIRRKEANAKS